MRAVGVGDRAGGGAIDFLSLFRPQAAMPRVARGKEKRRVKAPMVRGNGVKGGRSFGDTGGGC